MNEPLEKFIKESLEKESPPKLSPFFAAKVTNRIKFKPKSKAIWQFFLLIYWCSFSFFTLFMLSNLNWTNWVGTILLLLIIPISFILPSFSNKSYD